MRQPWYSFIKMPRHLFRLRACLKNPPGPSWGGKRTAAACGAIFTLACVSGCGLFQLGHPNLKSRDPSLKIPAIKQAAARHNAAAVPTLIKGLNSTDPAIRFYSAYALKQITGRTFGYNYYAPEYQRQLAILHWQHWLSRHVAAKQPAGGKS